MAETKTAPEPRTRPTESKPMSSELRATEDELRDLLVRRLEVLDTAMFDASVAQARRLRVPLERALIDRARLPATFLLSQLAEAWNVAFTDLKISDVKPHALKLVREDFAKANLAVSFDATDNQMMVAMWDPRDQKALAELKRMAGSARTVVPYLAPIVSIRRALLLYRAPLRDMLETSGNKGLVAMTKTTGPGGAEASAIDMVTQILAYAVLTGASDIHIEPYETESLIRYRIDGVLQEVMSLPTPFLTGLAARIKVMGDMRLDEKRAPQDGRLEATFEGIQTDARISTVPTHWGEKIVMRVALKEASSIDLEALGLTRDDYQIVLRHILKPFGMILITGPTGSGKTTTLYAMLSRMAAERNHAVNVSTIEDPVERPLPRVSQIAINPAAGLDFAGGLRALLRQDPDIIMVGEIRDRETADIGVRTALVGRLFLSTLHTNDSVGVVPRLIDMGVEPFLIASTLELVVAQRLARRICMVCRESLGRDSRAVDALRALPEFQAAIPALQSQGVLAKTGDPLTGVRLFRGRGCTECNGSGFRGRVGFFELFELNDEIRQLIMERRDASQFRTSAIRAGMKTMWEDALAKVLLGETTVEEAVRVTG